MRVLQVHNRYRDAGGEDTVVDSQTALLRAAGHDVHVAQGRNPSSAPASAWSLARAPWNGRQARAVEEVAVARDIDIAHVHNTWYALSPAVISRLHRAGLPVVMTLHNYRLVCGNSLLLRDGHPCEDCVGSHPWHAVQHACFRGSRLQSVPAAATIALHRARGTWSEEVTRFIVMTEFQKARMVAAGLPEARIDVRPHCTPDPGERPESPSRSERLVYVGRLSSEKGVADLVASFLAADTGLELVVIGDGPEAAALKTQAAGSCRVRFLGRLDADAVRAQLLGARALVFPSRWYETFGLSLVEAMAAGTPVVASALGGREDVLGEGCGLLFEAGDRQALSGALMALTDDATVDRTGAAARRRWQSRYTPAAALRGLEETYAHALQEHVHAVSGRRS